MKFTWIISTVVCMLILILLTGCAGTVPKEAITLSELLGQDLAKVQTSYQTIIRNQYTKMRENVESFVQEQYLPFVLKSVIEKKDVINNLKNKVDSGNYNDALNYLTSFSRSAHKRVQKFRNELLEPLLTQEQMLLEEIDLAFSNMRNANATITAHLKSLKKIQDEQDLLLERANLLDLKNSAINQTVKLSNKLNTFLESSGISKESSTKELLDGIKNIIDEVKKKKIKEEPKN